MADTDSDTPSLPLIDNTNPLRQYRSYSYHFFVIAAESTDVLEYLDKQSSAAFERPAGSYGPGGNPRQVINSPAGNYVIVIDTRHDTDFILDDVQWGTTFIGDPNSSNSTIALNTVMTDGILQILEPRGVNFLNVLAQLGTDLQVDMICMPYSLKVVFYGHTEDGTVVPLSAVQPFGFIPVDIEGSIDERGATYKMSICGVVNGIVYNPSYNAIVDNVGFEVPSGNLETVLASFTAQLNKAYADQRQQVVTMYSNATPSVDLTGAANIVYTIILENDTQELHKLSDFGSNLTQQFNTVNNKHIITGTKEGGIPEIIGKLLMSSKHWMEIAAQGSPPDGISKDNTSKRYTFKVTSEFEKASVSKGDSTVKVNIYVSEYRYETVDVVSTPSGNRQVEPAPSIDPDQVVNFDYIFTGRNVDILHMDINLNMGLALVQTLATNKSLSSQKEDLQGGQAPRPGVAASAGPSAGGFNPKGTVRKGTPIFTPLQWAKDKQKELALIQTSATADAIWSNFAGYQSINTAVTIHGNPLLLGKLVNPNRKVPNYVKINVKMPSTTDDIWEYDLAGGSPGGYYKPFWYSGYYLMLSAANKFKDGQFTQDLELISMPQVSNSQGQIAAQQDQSAPLSFTPQTSQSTPTATATPDSSAVTKPTNTSNTNKLASPTNTNPASPTHQAFIQNYWNYALQSSQSSGVDPDFLLAQAAVETGWGTNRFSKNYNTFFNVRSYLPPNQYWDGSVIPGTNQEAGKKVPGFKAYDGPTNSFADQAVTLGRLYPSSATAPAGPSGINQYANGLINGKGGRKWDATNPSGYVTNVINAYNSIQTYKSNLGIVANNYLGTPPGPPGTSQPYLAQNVSQEIIQDALLSSSASSQYATTRTVAQASIDQKKVRA